jgi:hypothetical protein
MFTHVKNKCRGNRGRQSQYRDIIQAILEGASRAGEKLKEKDLLQRIGTETTQYNLKNNTNIKTMTRGTLRSVLKHFMKEEKVDKVENKLYVWRTHYEYFNQWQNMINGLTTELRNRLSIQPRDFFEHNVIFVLPHKKEDHFWKIGFMPLEVFQQRPKENLDLLSKWSEEAEKNKDALIKATKEANTRTVFFESE